ncbi:MAG: MaoC family dehydratase [Pseudomonadota bacterium]
MTEGTHPLDELEETAHYFEELELGKRFPIPSRTMTDALFAAFQLASGDNHPIHYDVEYCRRHGHPQMLAHGFQALIQTAPGAGDFPSYIGGALVGFIEQSSRFLRPVYAGDTLYPMLEISELTPQRTTGLVVLTSTIRNQDGVTVLEGKMKFLVRKRKTGE